jgi:membrane-associated phospholipid phosphatase
LINTSQHIKSLLKENLAFLLPGFLFWFSGTIWLLLSNKSAIHLWVDAQHFPAGDHFFKYITYLGDGFLIITIIVLLFLVNRRFSAKALLFAYLSSTLIVQLIKASIPDNHRPYLYFYGKNLHVVDGVSLLAGSSFPSGHSAGAFCLFFVVGSFTHSKPIKALLGIFAVLVCLSRIYLNQHFLADTIVGGMIAVGCSAIVLAFLRKWENDLHHPTKA